MKIPEDLLHKEVTLHFSDEVSQTGVITETSDGYEVDIITSTRDFNSDDVLAIGNNFIKLGFESRFGPDS